jgi:uncharacterized protein YkwD
MNKFGKSFLLIIFIFLCGCGGKPIPGPGPNLQPDIVMASARLLKAVNAERAKKELQPYVENLILRKIAAAHAEEMAKRNKLDHYGADGSSPWDRMTRAGYNWVNASENVAWGQTSPEQAVSDWMASPGHRANILGPYKDFGSGIGMSNDGRIYWCADFGVSK